MSSSEAMRLTVAASMETNHDLAVRYLREAIHEDPDAVLPRFQLATILGARGLHSLAAQVLRPSVIGGAGGRDAGVRFLYARQLHLSGDLDALDQYEAVLILDPACEKAHLYLAQLLSPGTDTDHELAAEHAQRALELRPKLSMVPAAEFIETYRSTVGSEPKEVVSAPDNDNIGGMPLEDIVLLHPQVSRILEEVGISCVECAGYSTLSLRDAATEVDADLTSLINRIKSLSVLNERAAR